MRELPQAKPDGFASSLWEGASGAPASFALSPGTVPLCQRPHPRGGCRAQRDWGSLLPACPRAAAFSGVENCNFPRIFHTEKRRRPGVENLGPAIPDWRKINRRSGTVCRMQRKSFDFLFYKRQNACIFIQNFPESGCLNYGVYRADSFLLLKTRWKKWKTSRKTRPFLHKNS